MDPVRARYTPLIGAKAKVLRIAQNKCLSFEWAWLEHKICGAFSWTECPKSMCVCIFWSSSQSISFCSVRPKKHNLLDPYHYKARNWGGCVEFKIDYLVSGRTVSEGGWVKAITEKNSRLQCARHEIPRSVIRHWVQSPPKVHASYRSWSRIWPFSLDIAIRTHGNSPHWIAVHSLRQDHWTGCNLSADADAGCSNSPQSSLSGTPKTGYLVHFPRHFGEKQHWRQRHHQKVDA